MADQLPVLIVLAPLQGALLAGLLGMKDHRVCFPIVIASLIFSLFAAISTLQGVLHTGEVARYFLGGWDESKGPLGIGIELRVDTINGMVLIAIATVAILAAIFSIRRAGEETTDKTPQFYVLFLLLCVGLFGMTITADAFNLFVMIEVSSLTSYGLIAMGKSPRGSMAAFNYVIMGTIGASFYLLGVGYLYLKTGSLHMAQIQSVISETSVGQSPTILVAFIFILVGVWIKMAFFPLFGWLPNAYSYCPSTTSCLLAPLVTKVSVYVMIRVMIGIFGWEWIVNHVGWASGVVWLAVIAILAGSCLALSQREIKKCSAIWS